MSFPPSTHGRVLPGGVTANARVNPALGEPFYVTRGDGPYVYGTDGRRYVDLCMSNRLAVTGYRQAARFDRAMLQRFCREMHRRGVYVNPAWHHGISAMHTVELVDEIVAAAAESARAVVQQLSPG